MNFQGAVIKEQGVRFAVVIVKPHIIQNTFSAQETIAALTPAFDGLPVVLMAQDSHGRATYRGRPDLARFMASVPVSAVPWRNYSLS